MAFIDVDYLKSLGYRIPNSSVENVNTMLDDFISDGELVYLQKTIGYSLTSALYGLIEPYPSQVEIFLNGNLVDGDEYYKGILREISSFIMSTFYGQLGINVNNSGFSSPISDGENMVDANFVVNNLVNYTHKLRCSTYYWLYQNNNDFFADWDADMFKTLDKHSVW